MPAPRIAPVFSSCLGLIVCATASFAHAAFVPGDFKPNVVDEAQVLSPEEVARLNTRINELRSSSGILGAVYLVPSLNGDSIEQAATATFEKWKLGQIGEDNGLLIIASIGDRRARIETGYGLEGDIPDVVAKRLLDNILLPAFKNELYADGLDSTLATVAAFRAKDSSTLSSEQKWTAYTYRRAASGSVLSNPGLWPFYAWVLALLFIPAAGRAWRWAAGRPLDHPGRPTGTEALLHIVLGPTSAFGNYFGRLLIRLFFCVNPGLFIAILGYQWSGDAKTMTIMLAAAALAMVTSAALSFVDPKLRNSALWVAGKTVLVTFASGVAILIVGLLGFGGWHLIQNPTEFFDFAQPALVAVVILTIYARLIWRKGGRGGSGSGSSSSSSRGSSRSSSSSSSSRSSSGGGRSGGGGASGSW